MKRTILGMAVATLMAGTAFADDTAGVGVYSEGYRIGQLTKFSVKGLMMKSGEGQMLVGNESTPYQYQYKCGDKTCTKTVNPWYFSADPKWESVMNDKLGEYVVIKYSQAQVKGISRDTDYSVVDVQDLASRDDLPASCVATSFNEGSKSEGSRVGRMVKMSSKGHLNKTFEVTFQQGNSGNQFKNMTISTPEMYDCALKFMKAGVKVKIQYSQSFFKIPGMRDTTYDIVSIKPVSSGMN